MDNVTYLVKTAAGLAESVSHTVRHNNRHKEIAMQVAAKKAMDATNVSQQELEPIPKPKPKSGPGRKPMPMPKPMHMNMSKQAGLMEAIEALNEASRSDREDAREAVVTERNALLSSSGVDPAKHVADLDDLHGLRRTIRAGQPLPTALMSTLSGLSIGLPIYNRLKSFGILPSSAAKYGAGVGGAVALASAAGLTYKGYKASGQIGDVQRRVDLNVQQTGVASPTEVNAMYGGYDPINRAGGIVKRASELHDLALEIKKHKENASTYEHKGTSALDHSSVTNDNALYHKGLRLLDKSYQSKSLHRKATDAYVTKATGGKFQSASDVSTHEASRGHEGIDHHNRAVSALKGAAGASLVTGGLVGATFGGLELAGRHGIHRAKASAIGSGLATAALMLPAGAISGFRHATKHNETSSKNIQLKTLNEHMSRHGLTQDHLSA